MERPATGVTRPLSLHHPSGSGAEAYAHGGTVTSFTHPVLGDVLFLSKLSRLGNGVAIRGGIPVVFPQFAADGPLPRHGFVRTATWEVAEQEESRLLLRLVDTEATRALWAYQWTAELLVEIEAAAFHTTLTIINSGRFGFAFTCALHTYLRVQEVRRAHLQGLAGVTFRDRLSGSERSEREDVIRVRGPIDRLYVAAPDRVSLRDNAGHRLLILEKQGFEDLVVWNPWAVAARTLSDLGDEEYREFLCVEPGNVVQPIFLDSGERWTGRQTIRVEPAAPRPGD